MHENACKGLHEGTGRFFKNVDLERQSPLDVFLRDKTIFNFFFFFWQSGVAPRLQHPYMCTENVMFPCISWERSSLHFLPREKISYFRKKNSIFPDNTRKLICWRSPFSKGHLFRNFEEIFLRIFLRKIIFRFPFKV